MGEKQSERRRRRGRGIAGLGLLILCLWAPAAASAAAAPGAIEVWTSATFSSSVRLQARINPNDSATHYRFDYIAKSAYDANLVGGKDPFAGTSRIPPLSDANIGTGNAPVNVLQPLSGLSVDTTYRYRLVAANAIGTTTSPTLTFATQATGGGILPDDRGWEMVSPVDKNGGQAEPPGALAGGGVLQAAAGGGAVVYGSAASYGSGGQGAATASQYLATRAGGGWANQNITAPLYSSSYSTSTEGVPYQLFSGDLARGLLLNGRRCRGEGTDCAVPNPPLAGTDAPVGYQNYYLREGPAYTALLGVANAGFLDLEPADFELRLAGAAPDLRHVVLSTCAALTANATEVPPSGGCDPAETNLYEYSPGTGLALVNLKPGDSQGTPGAALGAQSDAVSADGARVYFTQGGSLYLRDGSAAKQVDLDAGGGGTFQAASADGSVAYFTKAGHLWRYLAAGAGAAIDLTASGGVDGVLGSSESGADVYYLTSDGLFRWHSGTTTKVADAADASNYPPATGTARVSADGTKLLFVSTPALTGYDNKDLNTGLLDSQVYLYDAAGAGTLTCVSCNPTFGRPIGPSSIPGAIANGTAPGSTRSYKPRVLSAGGQRVFFASRDAIGLADTNGVADVYQWEAQGMGTCARAGGCVNLISSGRSVEGASFVDASADGSDAFFLTDGSLIEADPGATDLYDARVGGGFPVSSPPIACKGDACQPLPSEPIDPTLGTQLVGLGNPAVRYPGVRKSCRKGYVKRRGKCVRKKKANAKQAKKTPKRHRDRGGR
jgi:hypothetical protein